MVKCAKRCEVYSRIVGYYRPVAQWNIGKKEEFKDRLEYSEELAQRGWTQDQIRDAINFDRAIFLASYNQALQPQEEGGGFADILGGLGSLGLGVGAFIDAI